jgi:hypothetical protein
MKSNTSVSTTCTLNAEDLFELYKDGELQDNGVVIGTTEPELERFKEMVVEDAC